MGTDFDLLWKPLRYGKTGSPSGPVDALPCAVVPEAKAHESGKLVERLEVRGVGTAHVLHAAAETASRRAGIRDAAAPETRGPVHESLS